MSPSSTLPTQWSTSSRLRPSAAAGRLLDLPVARREDAVVVAPVDERVERLAVGADRATAQDAVLAAVELGRLQGRPAPRVVVSRNADRVVDREGDVVDAVAVAPDVLGDLAVRRQRRGEHERDVVLRRIT